MTLDQVNRDKSNNQLNSNGNCVCEKFYAREGERKRERERERGQSYQES